MSQKKNQEKIQSTSKNKGLKIAIITTLIIILLLIVAICCMYFFTDLFKSNKELFFKYTAQIVQQEDGFLDNSLLQYLDNKKSNPYEDNGSIDFNITIPDMGQDEETLNNFNISFSGKVDNANLKNEQSISLNYSDDVKFPFYYRKADGVQGIKTDYIGSKYVATKDGEEIEGVDLGLETLDKITSFNNIQIPYNEIQNIKNTYFDNILNQISNDKFSKISEENRVGYVLSLSDEELKNVLTEFLETLKNDENTLNSLNNLLGLQQSSSKIRVTDIDESIKELEDAELGDIKITVYESDGKISAFALNDADAEIYLEKMIENDEQTYKVELKILENSKSFLNASMVARFSGVNTNNISENYEVLFEINPNNVDIINQVENSKDSFEIAEETEKLNLLLSEIKFKKLELEMQEGNNSALTIEDINEIINSASSSYSNIKVEQAQENRFNIIFTDTNDVFVIDNSGKIIEEPTREENSNTREEQQDSLSYKYEIKNTVQFSESSNIESFSEENAVILNEQDEEYVNSLMNAIEERITIVNQRQMEELGVAENQNPILYITPITLLETIIYNTANSTIDAISFNNKFYLYEGKQKGVTVKGLLSTIALNNGYEDSSSGSDSSDEIQGGRNNNPQITEIHFDGEEYEVTEQNITLIKDTIETETLYRVEFELDSNTGLIYRVVINKQ